MITVMDSNHCDNIEGEGDGFTGFGQLTRLIAGANLAMMSYVYEI